MRLSDLNWFDVETYLKDDDRLILVMGSCEQHGYLSLLTDVKIPLALADAASQQSGVIVAPALNFGASPYFLAYPGTISLRLTTLMEMLVDIIRSVNRQGFRRILVLNGHGGNEPVRGRMYELVDEIEGLRIAWYTWWNSHSVEAVLQKHKLKSYHAGWIEAFPFTRVAELPDGEKIPPKIPGLIGADEARDLYGNGVFGGQYQVNNGIMEEIFTAATKDVVHLLRFGDD
jgi:creatinine amidohydrolase